jgi:predicted RNase H-like HicB family nuclease
MTYQDELHRSEDGYAVRCPALPGCWSQGASVEDALENIRDAIREYQTAAGDLASGGDVGPHR